MLYHYQDMIVKGEIVYDQRQVNLIDLLENYSLVQNKLPFFLNKKQKLGIYIYGSVGCGKSMIMELYYKYCNIVKKYKIHFTEFIAEIHSLLNKLQMESVSEPLKIIGKNIAKKFNLLCLDEFQISDIADAMIFSKLLPILLTYKIIIVITSNYSPDQLYLDGSRRELFLSTINSIIKNMHVTTLDGEQDYRRKKLYGQNDPYCIGLGNSNNLKKILKKITKDDKLVSVEFDNYSRKIHVKRSYNNIAYFDFNELCQVPLWSTDYLIIAKNFSDIFIEEIPVFDLYNQNERKRFTALIDILYDNKNRLFCCMEREPQNLYFIEEIPIDFQRTISRLIEMRLHSASFMQNLDF